MYPIVRLALYTEIDINSRFHTVLGLCKRKKRSDKQMYQFFAAERTGSLLRRIKTNHCLGGQYPESERFLDIKINYCIGVTKVTDGEILSDT